MDISLGTELVGCLPHRILRSVADVEGSVRSLACDIAVTRNRMNGGQTPLC